MSVNSKIFELFKLDFKHFERSQLSQEQIKCCAKAVILSIYMDVKIINNNYFIWVQQ